MEIHDHGSRTRSLLHVTDLFDQIAHLVKPTLAAGYVVVADRWRWTPVIRESVRGTDEAWLREIYADVPQPDAVVVLDAKPRRLLDRALWTTGPGRLARCETGRDIGLDTSPATSFLAHQRLLRARLHAVAEELGAPVITGHRALPLVHEDVWQAFLPAVEGILHPLQPVNGAGRDPSAEE